MENDRENKNQKFIQPRKSNALFYSIAGLVTIMIMTENKNLYGVRPPRDVSHCRGPLPCNRTDSQPPRCPLPIRSLSLTALRRRISASIWDYSQLLYKPPTRRAAQTINASSQSNWTWAPRRTRFSWVWVLYIAKSDKRLSLSSNFLGAED